MYYIFSFFPCTLCPFFSAYNVFFICCCCFCFCFSLFCRFVCNLYFYTFGLPFIPNFSLSLLCFSRSSVVQAKLKKQNKEVSIFQIKCFFLHVITKCLSCFRWLIISERHQWLSVPNQGWSGLLKAIILILLPSKNDQFWCCHFSDILLHKLIA